MTVLKHIGVLSLAKIMALIGLVVGLLVGIFWGALFAVAAPFMPGYHPFAALGGFAIVVLCLVLGAVGGFIHGAVVAFLYNVFADWIGGVDVMLV